MAHLGFIAPPLPGHLNPMAALARALVARGHRATFVHQADVERLVSGDGIGFRAVGRESHPPGHLSREVDRLTRLDGVRGLRPMIRDTARATDMLCREVPAALRELGVDAVVSDQMEAAGGLVAAHLRLPWVSVANGLMLNREPDVPPAYVGWGYDPTERGRWWNVGGYKVVDWLMADVHAVVERHARAFGLPGRRTIEDCFSAAAQVSQAVPGFDFPRRALPEGFHYAGPLRDPDPPEADPPPMPPDDGRPLVYASLGTLQGGRAHLFRRIAAACRDLDVRLVIAHGGRLSEARAASLPGQPLVLPFVPQRALLRHAAVAVSNAGLNTILDSLSRGVPVVALPIAFEQGATAARLARTGAGEVVSPRFLTTRRLRATLERVLTRNSYRERAASLRDEIEAAGGTARAADIVEAVLSGAGVPARAA